MRVWEHTTGVVAARVESTPRLMAQTGPLHDTFRSLKVTSDRRSQPHQSSITHSLTRCTFKPQAAQSLPFNSKPFDASLQTQRLIIIELPRSQPHITRHHSHCYKPRHLRQRRRLSSPASDCDQNCSSSRPASLPNFFLPLDWQLASMSCNLSVCQSL